MVTNHQLQRLKEALQTQRRTIEELEAVLSEIEATLPKDGEPAERLGSGEGLRLLPIAEVCRILGMGKSWTYRRLKSGEIPSVKLGRSIKVKREDLEEYLDSRRYRPADEE
jgi:excisionase family DNA binding protein